MKKKSLVLIFFIIAIFSFTNFSGEKNNIVNAKSSQTIEKNKPAEELKEKENIVFLGDSITEIYPINKIYGDLPIIKSGVSGYKTEDILKRMDSMEVLWAAAIIQSVDIHERLEWAKTCANSISFFVKNGLK